MVKIKLKTLANKTFDMELDSDLNVADLKQQINEQFGFGEPELLKLIYTGKVLKDDQTVTQAGVKEGGFIVVMVTKKKEQAAPTLAPASSAPSATSASTPSATAAAAAAAPSQPAGPPASAAPVGSSQANASSALPSDMGMVRGPAYEQAVENLMALGFERAQVVRAMQASFNNPDRAAEYLFNGIPESEQAPAAADGGSGSGADASGSQQQVQQVDIHTLQQMFQDRPELVEALINQIGASNPQLLQALGNNRAAFTQMLQNPVAFAQILQAAGIAGPMSSPDGAADMNAENVIHVTPADRQAIERLESLGFSRDRVLEAYLACDRNEEVAANYLFENGNEPDSDE